MKQLIIFITLFLVTIQGFSQMIVVNSEGTFINSKNIKEFTKDSVSLLLDKPSRKFFNNYHWTYDKIGIGLKFGEANILEDIEIQFKSEGLDFSPKNNFTGELTVFGVKLSRETPLSKLKKIKELKFEKNHGFNVLNARVGNLVLTFNYLDSVNKLNGVSISQGSHELLDLLKLLEENK
jgi:hypothetical protein